MANITKGTSSWNVNVEPGETVTLNTGKSYVDRNIAVYANNSIPWSNITGKPTTLSGYGITDALKSDTKYAAGDYKGGNALHALHLGSNSSTNFADQGGFYWFNLDGKAGAVVDTNDTPTSAWWYIQRNRHTNQGNNYYTDVAIPFNDSSIYYKRVVNGAVASGRWIKVFDDLNYTNYVPKKDGTGASGTWGISVTGSSASATNDSDGNKISSTYLKLSGGTLTGLLNIKPNSSNWTEGIRMHPYNGWTTLALCGTDNTGDTGTSAKTWSIHNRDGLFYITKNGSDTSSSAILSCIGDNIWRMNGNVVLHAGNYNSYAPTKTGTGASGTWGISITGNAATAIKATQDSDGNTINTTYLKKAGGTLTGPLIASTTKMNLSAGLIKNISTGTTGLFADGIAISNPTTMNDVGFIRVTGTGESDTVLEISTGDDSGAGESIVARQYSTSNTIAHEAVILDHSGNTTFPGTVKVGNHVTLQYDSSLSCLNFVFS